VDGFTRPLFLCAAKRIVGKLGSSAGAGSKNPSGIFSRRVFNAAGNPSGKNSGRVCPRRLPEKPDGNRSTRFLIGRKTLSQIIDQGFVSVEARRKPLPQKIAEGVSKTEREADTQLAIRRGGQQKTCQPVRGFSTNAGRAGTRLQTSRAMESEGWRAATPPSAYLARWGRFFLAADASQGIANPLEVLSRVSFPPPGGLHSEHCGTKLNSPGGRGRCTTVASSGLGGWPVGFVIPFTAGPPKSTR